MRPLVLAVFVLSLGFLLPACDSADEPFGEFVGTIRGDETLTLQWKATFGDGKPFMLSGGEEGRITVYPDPDYSEPGRYVIGRLSDVYDSNYSVSRDTFTTSLSLRPSNLELRRFDTISGELVLDAVTEMEIRGSIMFTAVDIKDSTRTVEVQGQFVAVFTPFCC